MGQPKVFSAPGKALIAGGYLVLDPQYSSYVTALSARTHAMVELKNSDSVVINISSPQFNSKWSYHKINDEFKEVNGSKNPFLESTVEIVMKYLGEDIPNKSITITIFSDPGFHTQDNSIRKKSNNGKKFFLYHGRAITEVPKTGLGSSASLVSVVTTALISTFKQESINDLKNLIHNLGQIAHCKAQKKIGSGFDVATAVYGSIKYQRFNPEVINEYITEFSNINEFQSVVNSNWDFDHTNCSLPPHLKIIMGDIKGGSETPKLVNIVLNWKKNKPEESLKLYTNLNNANLQFIKCLGNLHDYYENNQQQYLSEIEKLSQSDNLGTAGIVGPFKDLIDSLKLIRKYLKQLTIESTADIEPEAQTLLLDKVNTLTGVLGGVVPGAGGYDAISLVVIDSSIPSIISQSKSTEELNMIEWLDLEEESEGIVEENIEDYKGL